MQSLISKLFNGEPPAQCEKLINPAIYVRNTKMDEVAKKEASLLNTLNEEQKNLFNEWRTDQDDIWCDEVDLAYERGFKTGALLMIEVHDIHF